MCCLFIGKGRVIFNSLQVYKNIPICINNAADYLSRYHAHPRILSCHLNMMNNWIRLIRSFPANMTFLI